MPPNCRFSSSSSRYSYSSSSYAWEFCGDGVKQVREQCDDGQDSIRGNGSVVSNCTITCQLKTIPGCGNGVLAQGEECDDGNLRDGDGCNRLCKLELGFCGDGILEAALGEECDAGADNGQPYADCDARCKYPKLPDCGDGVVDPLTEQCDSGADNGNYAGAPCRGNCMLPYCGDGVPDPNEECDDGNNIDGDTCNADCTLPSRAAPNFIAGELVPGTNVSGTMQQGTDGATGLTGRYTTTGNQQNPQNTSIRYPTNIPTPARTPTGPGLVIFLASGAAAGIGIVRRRLRGIH